MIDTRQAGHGCNGFLTIYSERNKGSELPHTRSYMLLELQAADQPEHCSKTLWEGKGQIPNLFPSNSMSSTSVERTACYYILT